MTKSTSFLSTAWRSRCASRVCNQTFAGRRDEAQGLTLTGFPATRRLLYLSSLKDVAREPPDKLEWRAFGVTTPLWDYVFRTMPQKGRHRGKS